MAAFQLPALQARESQELDFKSEPTTKDGKINYLELAKDMAAMANAYGSVIIVGACENPKGILSFYKTVSKERAAQVCDEYATAHRDRLRPAPIVVPEPIDHDGGFLVIVSVEASVGQAIGVRFLPREDTDPSEQKAPQEIFGFPVRVGDNTIWLQPEQLSMLMLPELRRTILLLHKIGSDLVKLDTIHRLSTADGTANYTISKIDPELNALLLSSGMTIPIDQIRSIYRRGNEWRIAYASSF
jgi:hypothetical protein